MTNEERLQYAKDNYPVGTKFKSSFVGANGEQQTGESKGDFKYYGDDILCRITKQPFEGWITCYNSVQDKWAEIISKPEEKLFDNSFQFHTHDLVERKDLKSNKITHEEAIEGLERFKDNLKLPFEQEYLQYAINQLKQCEVYSEPVVMEVSDNLKVYAKKVVRGKFLEQFVYESEYNHTMLTSKYARLIQKEPLSFLKWCQSNDLFAPIPIEAVIGITKKYQEYLKEFKEDNQ